MNEDQENDDSSGRRPIRKRQREYGSQTDEECLMARGHCCDASENMKRLQAKIDQLLAVLPELEALKTRLIEVEKENKELRNAVSSSQELTELKASMVNTCSLAADNADELDKLKAEIQQQKCRNIKLEVYTRRENIKIFNLPGN